MDPAALREAGSGRIRRPETSEGLRAVRYAVPSRQPPPPSGVATSILPVTAQTADPIWRRRSGRATRRIRRCVLVGVALGFVSLTFGARGSAAQASQLLARDGSDPAASAESDSKSAIADRSSPWLLLPVVASNPKLGTAFGALGAYLTTFDPGSRVSMPNARNASRTC